VSALVFIVRGAPPNETEPGPASAQVHLGRGPD